MNNKCTEITELIDFGHCSQVMHCGKKHSMNVESTLDKVLPQRFPRALSLLEDDLLGCKDCDYILSIFKRRRTPQLDSWKDNMVEGTPY